MQNVHYLPAFTKISAEKQQKILDAAIIEFAEHGYDSANINHIAERAEISIGAMYKYFGNKEGLYLTVVQHGVESLSAVLEEIIQSEDDLLGRIQKIIEAIQTYTRSNINLTKLYNQMTAVRHSELVWKIASHMEGVTAQLYASFIAEAQRDGLVRTDINPKLFAFFLDNLFMQLQFSYSCEYYKERLKMFVGEDVFEQDELVVTELMKFIKGAFFMK